MKKLYEDPIAIIFTFERQDVITTSGEPYTQDMDDIAINIWGSNAN